jgi:hypothetical protein
VLSWGYVVVYAAGVEITGIARPSGSLTIPGMPKRQARLDHRSLLPNSYLNDPDLFGGRLAIKLVVPDGGDEVSRQVALVQHRLSFALVHPRNPKLAAAVQDKFGFSPSWWSKCLRGKGWMGETVLAAAVGALLDTLPDPETYP